MKEWLGCVKIYDSATKTINTKLGKEALVLFSEFKERVGHNLRHSVWYDAISPKCIGADETYQTSIVPNEACFLTNKEDFLSHSRWGISHALKNYNSILNDNNFRIYDDIYYENDARLKKYKDSTILIVGAGPTSAKVKWEKIKCDYVWTCNHFYLNGRFKNVSPSLIYINNEMNLQDPRFQRYAKQPTCHLALDSSITRSASQIKYIQDKGWNSLVFSQRIFLTCGAMPKLISFATYLGAKKVIFVGMDGWTEEQLNNKSHVYNHVFEKNKKLKMASNYNFSFQRRELVVYWDYLLSQVEKNTQYQNLGEPYDECIVGKISKLAFKLQKEQK